MSRLTVSKSYRSTRDFEEATRDRFIEVVEPGVVRLAKPILLTDELGRINGRTVERVTDRVWAKKEFLIENQDVESAGLAVLMSCENDVEGAPLYIDVNGHTVVHKWVKEREYWSQMWTLIPIPVGCLRRGRNQFVFHADKGCAWRLWVENSLWPNRSAKSVDGGRTWDYGVMGVNNSCDGEYVVRLRLGRYARTGVITSPPIDIASLASADIIRRRIEVEDVAVRAEKSEPPGTRVNVECRMGSTPSYDPQTWSAWAPPELLLEERRGSGYEFLQWRAALSTEEPGATPELRNLTLEADIVAEESPDRSRIEVVDAENERIVRSSYQFAYQPYEEERLRIMRERYELDWVVKPGKTEMERFTRLRSWVRRQWEDGWKTGLNWGGRLGYIDFCPPWDSLVILELASRKLSLGMCTHYATVFTHACMSVGLVARTVIIRSHCINEVWSNEHGKWVAMDVGGDFDDARKGTFHFERNGVPMNALELHRAWLNKDFEGIKVVPDTIMTEGKPLFKDVKERIELFDRFCVTLRNDELTSLEPGEPEHGRVSYHYDGYLWWRDESSPSPWFSLQTSREADLYWTLNRAEIRLQRGSESGLLNVSIDTVTPNFARFLVKIDDGEWSEKPASFEWRLHEGVNKIQAKPVNKFGVEGVVSTVSLAYRQRPST